MSNYDSELAIAISKMHSVVIGPGLGRSETAWEFAKVFDSYLFSFYLEKLIILLF